MIFENFANFVPPQGGEPRGGVVREARHYFKFRFGFVN